MVVMTANGLGKSYGVDTILEGVSFSVESGDRIGIVGPNGAGKTTLLRMLTGDMEPTSGSVYIRSGTSVGYVRQKNNFDGSGKVLDEVEKSFKDIRRVEEKLDLLAKEMGTDSRKADEYTELLEKYKDMGGYSYEGESKGILKNMGFEEADYDKKISMLSGGERTRLALACMLMKHPDILILDEPTNHLDLKMLDRLEKFLSGYRGTMLVVSHDRFFLDRIATRIFDVRNCTLRAYKGTYSEYVVKRKEIREAEARAYQKEQAEIEKQEEMIRRFKERGTEKLAKRARSREKKLSHVERMARPEGDEDQMKLSFGADYKSGNDVLELEDVCKSFDGRQLFRNVTFSVHKGDRVCFVGDNGVGKTTLLKIIMGLEEKDSGYLKLGHNVNIGYYDQGQMLLDESETVLGEMKNTYHLYTDTQMRSILGRFLFRGDDVFKTISSLSGGEKAKLSLLKLMLSGANTLILDEPTNHLDIDSREAVEDAIEKFDGTVIIVSHDRYLLNRIPDRILELTPDGIKEYLGKFDYYKEKKEQEEAAAGDESSGNGADDQNGSTDTSGTKLSAAEERRLQKEQEAEERRKERRRQQLEDQIKDLEKKIADLEAEMCKKEHLTDGAFLHKCDVELKEMQAQLDDTYEEWIDL